jgi:biopolymer transport protein ExbB
MPYHISPQHIIDGTLYALLAFSVLTWTVIAFKIWEFGKSSYYNHRFNRVFWETTDLTAAQNLPEYIRRGPLARIVAVGFTWLADCRQNADKQLKYRGTPADLLEHTLLMQMQQESKALESGLTLLASIGSTAPFVGLFGTVLGIMHAMHEITQSGSTSLDVVAGPIGDALVATAIGIAVAVPAVLAYNFFLRLAKQYRAEMANHVVSFMHVAFSDQSHKE